MKKIFFCMGLLIVLGSCASAPITSPIRASGFIIDPTAPPLLQSDYIYDPQAPPLRASGFTYPNP